MRIGDSDIFAKSQVPLNPNVCMSVWSGFPVLPALIHTGTERGREQEKWVTGMISRYYHVEVFPCSADTAIAGWHSLTAATVLRRVLPKTDASIV